MKKWLGIILALIVVSIVLFYAYQVFFPKGKIASLESIVPEETMFYIYSYNLDKKIKDFESSDFFKQVSNSPVYKKSIGSYLERVKKKIPFFSDLIERDIACAVFSLGDTEFSRRDVTEMGNFLLLLRIDPKKHTKIKKSIADFYLSFVAKNEVSFNKYKGITITNYRLPQINTIISYMLISDVIAISNNNGLIQKSIDLFRKENDSSLLNNKNFQEITAKINRDTLFWGYTNNKKYYQEMFKTYTNASLRAQKVDSINLVGSFMKIKPFINLMNVLDVSSFYIDYDELKNGFVFKSYQTFNRAADQDNILNVIAYDRVLDKHIFNLIPWDVIAYYGGCQDLFNSWVFLKKFFSALDEMMKTEMKADPRYYQYKDIIDKRPGFETMLTAVESFLGVSIEKDILPLLGNDSGMVFTGFKDADISLSGSQTNPNFKQKASAPILFPLIYSFFELRDSLKMHDVMKQITQHFIDNVNLFIREQEKNREKYLSGRQKPQEGSKVEPKLEPIQEKQYLRLQINEYNGLNIYTIELLDFPIDLFKPNYCILDKHIIFSLSPMLTKEIIDIYKNKKSSFNSNFYFTSVQKNITSDYSNILFFDFKKLIDNIRTTKSFNVLKNNLSKNRQRNFLQEDKDDIDEILNILSNINTFTFTNRMLDSQTMESSSYIKIEGL